MCGFAWCKDKPVRVGLEAATAKILCEKHNSALSDIDNAGGAAFAALREIDKLTGVRQKLKLHPWRLVKTTIDGPSFERWCLKAVINLSCNRGHPIGRDSEVAGRPSDRLVRIVFGLQLFVGRAGLYSITRVGMQMKMDGKVSFAPLFKNNLHIEAGLIWFRGFMYMLFLEEDGPAPLTGLVVQGEDLTNAFVAYHPRRVNFDIGKHPSQQLLIKW